MQKLFNLPLGTFSPGFNEAKLFLMASNSVVARIADLEILPAKALISILFRQNKSLMTEARWVKTYRDEMDVLKSQVRKFSLLFYSSLCN